MILEKFELFLFVLSFVFSSKFLFQFISMLRQNDPDPMKITKTNQVLLYLAVSYIITVIITIF